MKPTNRDDMDEAIEYAALLADICKLRTPTSRDERRMEQQVFERLGFETTFNKRGYMMRRPGESHWQSMPRILSDFGTAVHYTIGHRNGNLGHRLEDNWYVAQMCETKQPEGIGPHVAAWAVRLAKANRSSTDGVALTPAAALVAAWLRTHKT